MKHKSVRAKVVTHRTFTAHKKPRHVRRPVHHHKPVHRTIRRVTYASPLCGQRSYALNHMLNLPDLDATQPPIAAEGITEAPFLPIFIDVPPITGGGPGPITGPIILPPPVFPIGPGPIIRPPTPPTVAVPEPSNWAMMMTGMMLVGGGLRRARRKAWIRLQPR